MFLTFLGAAFGITLVLLVHQPIRTQRCAVQAVAGPSLTCEDQRLWDWPEAWHVGAAGATGATIVGGFTLPFVRRR